MLTRRGERLCRMHFAACAVGSVAGDSERLANSGMDDEIQRDAPLWLGAHERLPQFRRELRVVGLPKLLTGLQLGEINRAGAEGKFDVAAAAWRNRVDAAALFVAFFAVAGKHNAVARRHGLPGSNDDTPAANRR